MTAYVSHDTSMYCRTLQFCCDNGINNEMYFSIFPGNTSDEARNEDWGWPALGGPGSVLSEDIQWKCLRFPLSPVYSHLNFILMASVPMMEMT